MQDTTQQHQVWNEQESREGLLFFTLNKRNVFLLYCTVAAHRFDLSCNKLVTASPTWIYLQPHREPLLVPGLGYQRANSFLLFSLTVEGIHLKKYLVLISWPVTAVALSSDAPTGKDSSPAIAASNQPRARANNSSFPWAVPSFFLEQANPSAPSDSSYPACSALRRIPAVQTSRDELLLSNSCFSELVTAQTEVQGGWVVVHTATHPSHAVAAANGRSQL